MADPPHYPRKCRVPENSHFQRRIGWHAMGFKTNPPQRGGVPEHPRKISHFSATENAISDVFFSKFQGSFSHILLHFFFAFIGMSQFTAFFPDPTSAAAFPLQGFQQRWADRITQEMKQQPHLAVFDEQSLGQGGTGQTFLWMDGSAPQQCLQLE